MKKNIIKLMALLVFSAAAITSCSVENRNYRHDRYHRDRYHDRNHNGGYYDRNHNYHNGY